MSRIRPFLLLPALTLAACSDDGVAPPEGPHYTYVVSNASVPTDSTESAEFGLDLDGDKVVDNRLGDVLVALKGQGFDVQSTIAEAINEGSIILLLDMQTRSFSSTKGVGFQVKLGDKATAMPAPCTDAADTACRKHLTGTGSFAVAAGSPDNAAVSGKIVGGTFTGGPGDISLKIALGSTEGIQLDLIGARAKATGIAEDKIDSVVLAGALTATDLTTKVIPEIHAQIAKIITDACTMPANADCGCPTGTPHTILNLFDKNPKNCAVTVEEIANHSLIQSLLAPDVSIEGNPSLSLGIKVQAVKGTIR
jgi:hypothetical protein